MYLTYLNYYLYFEMEKEEDVVIDAKLEDDEDV
jgi:hypothetical protein